MGMRTTGFRSVAAACLVLTCAAGAGTAWGKGGGGGSGGGSGGTVISTAGVVVFGDGSSTATRGTYSMSPDGTDLIALTAQIYPMDVSRGQSRVTALMNFTAGQGLQALRADGTGSAVELIAASVRVTDARFSLDGAKIAYRVIDTSVSPAVSRITVADAVRDANGDVTSLANATVVYAMSNFLQGMDFSRDGTRLVLAMSNDLWTVQISNGALVQLTNTTEIEKYPRWSPVDDRIAYTRYDTAGIAVADLMTIDATTRATRTVVSGTTSFYAHEYACWAPDGVNLLFRANKRNVGTDLYQIPSAASGSAVSVTSGLGIQENTPAWGW